MISHFHDHHYWYYLLVLLSSCCITLLVIPSIIHVARSRHLYDDLSDFRKTHTLGVPRLGGVAIFVSFTITLLLADLDQQPFHLNYLITSCIMLFAIGIKDDLAGVGHRTKFFIESIAAFILVVPGNIRLSSLHSIFGIYELAYIPSVALSIIIIIFIVNAFNLIDGIDGLAAATGILANSIFSVLFIHLGQYELATVSLSITGAILGFLKFNITPAKVFMGDTGSLLIGLVSAVMALKFIGLSDHTTMAYGFNSSSSLGIVLAILIGPIADTFRIFIIRLAKGKSPFQADRNHIHHRILQLGFSHMQTTAILILLNGLIVMLAFTFSGYGNIMIISVIVASLCLFNTILTRVIRLKKRQCLQS